MGCAFTPPKSACSPTLGRPTLAASVLNDERAKGFSMLYLLQIYGLVLISVALVVLALYLAALVSLLVIRSVIP